MHSNRCTIRCPHCRERAVTMTSRELSNLVREIYFQCMGIECGHRFVAHLGIVRTLVPSMNPRDDVALPIVERRANDIIVGRTPSDATPARDCTSPVPPTPATHPPAPPALH